MAKLLWGQVYYQNVYAGILAQEPGERMSFTYDQSYLSSGNPAIAHTLPLQPESFIQPMGLPPYFDNLVAEGWLEHAQTKMLGKRSVTRFELLLAYGYDCAGAISIADPEPIALTQALQELSDPKEIAVFTNRSSLSGVQPKLALVQRKGKYYPSQFNELSTYIGKFPSREHADLIINEYLTTLAFSALCPDDQVVELEVGEVVGFSEPVLIIKRFDRAAEKRLHFEEMNQLLGKSSQAKYQGAYKDMADFIKQTKACIPSEIYRLYQRVLAGLLLGNTDMHLKNFAMFHTNAGLRLTPTYDQVAAALYDYKTIALTLAGVTNLPLGKLKQGNILQLGKEFNLSKDVIAMLIKQLEHNRIAAEQAILQANVGSSPFKDKLIQLMRKRWNGTFALIGQHLLKKP
jgi:serine/threonine-protein kinase HipA